ncbi:hypothetical protein Tco_0352022, partial [Tanacetum coccineum]
EFVAHLAEHFGLLTKEWLQGLTAWVALGPERQPNAMAAALEAAEDVPIADDGASAILTPVQAPQPPPLVAGLARTMAQRFTRVEEDVHEIRGALGEQREILDSMARDFSRFYTWTVNELSQMMSQVGVRNANSVIMEYLVKISKKARILELKRRHLKIQVLHLNAVLSRRITAYLCLLPALHKRPQRKQDQYVVSREDQ